MDEPEEAEPSLDQLSQAFAAAMGRDKPVANDDASSESESKPAKKPRRSKKTAAEPCPISPKSILEAILFVGHPENQPIEAQRVAALLRGVNADEIEALVAELNEDYEKAAMPFWIQPVGNGYQLELRAEFQSIRERFYGNVREARLSQHAVDVLAVVAYNQPIERDQLEKLMSDSRPVQRVLNQLIRRDLLARQKLDAPKRHAYVKTDRFLDLFQLRDLGDLPRTEDPQ